VLVGIKFQTRYISVRSARWFVAPLWLLFCESQHDLLRMYLCPTNMCSSPLIYFDKINARAPLCVETSRYEEFYNRLFKIPTFGTWCIVYRTYTSKTGCCLQRIVYVFRVHWTVLYSHLGCPECEGGLCHGGRKRITITVRLSYYLSINPFNHVDWKKVIIKEFNPIPLKRDKIEQMQTFVCR
jgi:hypothetical protein